MPQYYLNLIIAILCLLGHVVNANAAPTDQKINALNKQVLRVQVVLNTGEHGRGSGVVVAKNQVVTNCHVVANAASVAVVSNGTTFTATGIKPDWKHDVCVLEVKDLDLAPVIIGSSEQLQYEQSVFAIGYPKTQTHASSSRGVVKGLFPMDDSVVIRATSTFKVGASGGGVFDDDGQLVGLITLKSPGKTPYYYYMAVEWVQALLGQPSLPVVTDSALPFHATSSDQWPQFMKVVHPFLTKDWAKLNQVASEWVKAAPDTNEAWFYLAVAEYAKHDLVNAETHMRRVIAHNGQHSDAIYYLGLITEKNGQHDEALTQLGMLNALDISSANALKTMTAHVH